MNTDTVNGVAALAEGALSALDHTLPLRVGQTETGVRPKVVLDWQKGWADQLLAARAGAFCDETELLFLDATGEVASSVTGPELHAQAGRIACLLRRFVSASELTEDRPRVLLFGDNTQAYLAGFFGALYAGLIPVSGVSPALAGSVARLEAVAQDAAPAIVLGTRADLAAFQPLCGPLGAKWVPVEAAESLEELYEPWRGDRQAPAFIQYSSGSTRAPRGVLVSHENLLNNLNCQPGIFDLFRRAPGLSWLPFSHDMGLIGGPLLSLGLGGRIYLMQPVDFASAPRLWPEAIARYGVGFSGGPNFAYDLVSRDCPLDVVAELDLSGWRAACIGAEPVREETVRRFQEHFAPAGLRPEVLVPSYGLAETTLIVAAPPSGARPEFKSFSRDGLAQGLAQEPKEAADTRVLACCGAAIPGHALSIMDSETEEVLPEGQVGEIWVSGPSVALGYRTNMSGPGGQERFGLEWEGKRWFRTGDRGFLLEGALYVTGRNAELLARDGRVFDASDLAGRLQTTSAVSLSGTAVFTNAEGLVGLLEYAPPGQSASTPNAPIEQETQRLAQVLWQLCGCRDGVTLHWLRPGTLPRTPSGKVRLGRAQELFQEGAFQPWHQASFDKNALAWAQVMVSAEDEA